LISTSHSVLNFDSYQVNVTVVLREDLKQKFSALSIGLNLEQDQREVGLVVGSLICNRSQATNKKNA
jgi:hypothetical protein